MCRWVDDYFSAELIESTVHAMECFARLVRAVLGPDAVSERKLLCGNPLTILGLDVCVDGSSLTVQLREAKAGKWAAMIRQALADQHLDKRQVSMLTGRPSYAAQKLYYRLGRAMPAVSVCL